MNADAVLEPFVTAVQKPAPTGPPGTPPNKQPFHQPWNTLISSWERWERWVLMVL